ncbi:hypothetical protein [Nocardia asteroides]|uniref:hypothetical protein n=1 Tax=Nocardia asteroides TaxID=1824 RepID=UPI0033DC25E1
MLPWSELGAILFGAGLFSFWLDSYFERECSEVDEARLRRLLVEQAPARKEAVIKGFAFESEDLRRVATPELLDNIIGSSLALRLGDDEFARSCTPTSATSRCNPLNGGTAPQSRFA